MDADAKGVQKHEDCVIQDGVSCPRVSPWEKTSRFAGIPILVLIALGVFILVNSSIIALTVWVIGLIIFAYPLRYLVCARCPYYGQVCFTGMATLITRMFKKQAGKSMKLGLWLDVVMAAIIFLIPLPYSFRNFGPLMTTAWIAAFFFVFLTMTRIGCSVCPFTFCPIGKAGKAFWGIFQR